MRKHIFLTLTTCVLLSMFGSMAHAASVIEGLCDGQLGDPTKGKSKPGSGTISAATIFPKERLAQYAGMKIIKIRVGLALDEGFSNLRGWIRPQLDGEDMTTADITAPQVGWNVVDLAQPVAIPDGQDLVFGYSFEQTKSCKCISLGGLDEQEGFAPAANGFWLCKNGVWENRSADNYGSVCVEVVIEDDNLPEKDVAVVAASVDKPQVRTDDEMTLSFTARNTAMTEVNNVKYVVTVEGTPVAEMTSNTTLQHREQETMTCKVPANMVPLGLNYTIRVTAEMEGDQKEDNNGASVTFSTYDNSYDHLLLIEEFSTESCSNCPRAIETFATLMEEGFEEKTVSVVHHVGYNTDWLTVEDDKEYLWFYGISGSFAPAAMYDRRPISDYGGSNSYSGMGVVPVTEVGYPDKVRPMLNAALAFPAFVDVKPILNYDEATRMLNVTVEVEKMDIFDTQCTQPRLTVFVVEDSILHHNQAGYSSTSFRHRHVNRGALSDVWGDVLQFENGRAVNNYQITLPEDWDAHYVGVVAFVNNRDENDRNNNIVYNAAETSVKEYELGIHCQNTDMVPVSVEYYSPEGLRTQSSERLAIRVTRYADGTVSVVKYVR